MEISPRRSLSLDFDSSAVSPAASSYPPMYLNCRTNMYTMQAMKPVAESKVSRPFAMTSSLSMDSGTENMLAPKKENFISNIFSAVIEHITKVPGSLMTNINSTLSVTVVPNEGIISQEFFKSLTRSCEQLTFEHKNENQITMNISETLPNKSLYDTKSHMSYELTDNARADALSTKVSLDSQLIKDTGKKLSRDELDVTLTSGNSQENSNKVCHINNVTMNGSHTEIVPVNKGECPLVEWTETSTYIKQPCSSKPVLLKTAEVPAKKNFLEESCATGWHAMWQRVVNGMSERLSPQTASPNPEVLLKKSNVAVHSHTKPRRKTCTIPRGRGKGRGKSQLRRSGVSQWRHRKERIKQNICSNIQEDLEAWEDFECYDSDNEDLLQGTRQDEEQRSPCQDVWKHCSTLFEKFTFDEPSKLRNNKQRTRNGSTKCPLRVRYLPESMMEVDSCGSPCVDEYDGALKIRDFRPRLVSESSVDSEDSYCIVFESSSDSEYVNYNYDTVSDEDIEDDDKTTLKVRFNLEPTVHLMVQWDYAYRAARRGPWEEMARDRERFRGRIRCIERILEPILSLQHRKCVWQDRFNVDG